MQSLAQAFPKAAFTGIDTALTDEMIHHINQRSTCKNISILCNMPDKKSDKANLLLLLDVLEHVDNEECFLQQLQFLMCNNSKLIVTVPAFQYLFTDHDRFLKHFRRYNRKQLERVLAQSGFEIIYSGYIFCSLLPVRLLQKIFRARSAEKDNLHVSNKIINLIARVILDADAAISFYLSRRKIYLPGLSCFAVAELKKI